MYRNSQKEIIRLSQRIGVGAEGEVYEIQDRSDLVAKIYHETPPPEKAEKLIVLSRLGNERLFNISAWPVDALRDENDGQIIGFLMKKISQAEEVHALHSPKSRLQKFPEASWAFLIYVASNIARAVAAIHEHGFIIGDVNPKNILVTRKATVYLLDVDSFQISAGGKTWRCEGGFPEYTPPELQGVAFRDVDRAEEHDCFGLAVVIFQLLFIGRHPFSGRFLGAEEMPLEQAIREFRFAYGTDAETRRMRQPPGTLSLDAVPAPLAELFRRAFLSASPSGRPQPREWVDALDALSKSLKKCQLHSGHSYFQDLAECPWCEIETRARVRLFNFLLPGGDSQRGHFRLYEIWKEIERVETPDTPLIPKDKMLKALKPSSEVAAAAQARRADMLMAVGFSATLSFGIGLIVDFPLSFALLILVSAVAWKISGVEQFSLNNTQTIFQSLQSIPDDPLVQKVQTRWQQAKDTAGRLQEQYDLEAGNERWGAKRDELRKQKETYENLAQIRDSRLKRLASEARKNQFNEFLDQFEVGYAEIEGISSGIKTYLLSYGIETAADVTKQKLSQIPVVGESRSKKLLEWRRDLERRFVFDPGKGVSPEARINAEKEIDALRLRLEHELSGGAHYLSRVKQEIETSRQQLQPLLAQARRELAQAEKDCETAIKRNSFKPIMLALSIAVFIGMMMKWDREPPFAPLPRGDFPYGESAPPAAPAPDNAARVERRKTEAVNLYHLGVSLSQEGKFAESVRVLREAIETDTKLYEAYEELGYALYRLKKYEESAEVSKAAIRLHGDFGPYYNLGLAYVALKQWDDAKTAFEFAIAHRYKDSWEERYTQAFYYLGLSKARLGEAEQAIEILENTLKGSPSITVERLELGSLYLWIGKYGSAREQYRLLKSRDPALAKELMWLMKKHEARKLS
ncbi:MAG: hypothetical protein JMDDDDMK_02733 [Acidobacteria bacterium]|nr:hypothetical protein [Acidobacteriota bacterium]